jgi:hypothetical protein
MHKRKIGSVKIELLRKSREAMLSAVQIFNNPNILFKAESFIVLSIVSWTYLLHAYYRSKKIDYSYYTIKEKRKHYDKTKYGAHKHWELERCLNEECSPIDKTTSSNLRFLIGLRHEIEHQMTTRIDDYLSARFQACCLNYNDYIKKLFGDDYRIDKYLAFSLQFSSISEGQATQLKEFKELPNNIASYILNFDDSISENEYNDIKYSYRVLYVQKSVNKKGQADKVIEFIPANSPEAEGLNKEYVLIKEREKPKYYAKNVISAIKAKGYKKFGISLHTKLWKSLDAKNEAKGFGAFVGGFWFWYDSWINEIEKYCLDHKSELI